MTAKKKLIPSLVLACALALGGCITKKANVMATADAAASAKSFVQFTDIPVPEKSKMVVEDTMVFGSGDTWTGRLHMLTNHGAFEMFDFFKQSLPTFNWTEITSLRAANSILTYRRGNRVATFYIVDTLGGSSEVVISISPEAGGGPGAVAPAMPVQPSAYTPQVYAAPPVAAPAAYR